MVGGCDAARECFRYAGFVGVEPAGKTLRILYWMALGKAEMLGMTRGASRPPRIPYDPEILAGAS